MAAAPHLLVISLRQTKYSCSNLQEAQDCDVDVCGQDLPEELCPLEEDVGDVEDLENPDPVSVAETQVRHDTSSLRIADVASVEVGEHIEKTDNGKHLPVKLFRPGK